MSRILTSKPETLVVEGREGLGGLGPLVARQDNDTQAEKKLRWIVTLVFHKQKETTE